MLSQLFKYGALNGKIHAMLGARMTSGDYDAMMNLRDVSEVAQYLSQNGPYRACLSGIDTAQIHRGTLEALLRSGLDREYMRLSTFSNGPMRSLLRCLLLRAETTEILRFMRFLAAGHPGDFTISLPEDILAHSRINYSALTANPTAAGLNDALSGSIYAAALADLNFADSETTPYVLAETAVQTAHYRSLFENINRNFSGSEQKKLLDYFKMQCDFRNIVRIVRIKEHFKIAPSLVLGYLIPFSYKLRDDFLKTLVNAETHGDVMNLLRTSGPYCDIFSVSESSIEAYQFEFFRSSRVSLHSGTPSAFTAVSYLDMKETELSNIIKVVECVRYNIPASRAATYLSPIY